MSFFAHGVYGFYGQGTHGRGYASQQAEHGEHHCGPHGYDERYLEGRVTLSGLLYGRLNGGEQEHCQHYARQPGQERYYEALGEYLR